VRNRETQSNRSSLPTNMPDKKNDRFVQRGQYGSTPFSRSIFIGIRTASIFLQYGILAQGLADPLLNYLNVSRVPNLAPAIAFGLPLGPLLFLAMAVGSSVKQSYWVAFIGKEELLTSSAIIISFFNSVGDTIYSVLSLTATASAFTPSFLTAENDHGISAILILSTVSFFVGLAMEAGSEIQRKVFKDDPKNAGKLYTGGLFGLARHINYGGYSVWRASYALATGGWIWATMIGGFSARKFSNRVIPVMDDYCTGRYGAQWNEYKNKVPYKLIPGIY